MAVDGSGLDAGTQATHALHDELNNESGLHRILHELHLPQAFEDALHEQGIKCIADFSYAYASTSDLDSFANNRGDDFWTQLGVSDPLHCMHMARLRRALVQAQIRTKQYEAEMARTASPPSPAGTAPAASSNAPPSDSWAEHAPQRIDNDTVARMVAEFKESYPGELLDSNSMPSIRLLSLVNAWFSTAKPRIKYVPWQFRMSQRQYTEIVEARAYRVVRTGAQLVSTAISTALFDDTPTIGIESHSINESWLGARQRIFRNAIALCKGAHLAVLKALDAKILELCTQVWKPGHGLRNVSTEEMLEADRKIWHCIATLVEEQNFSLDEALHEMTHVRGDVHNLLQARARTYAPPPQPTAPHATWRPTKGNGKGKDRPGKPSSPNAPQRTINKDQTAATLLAKAMQSLQLSHGSKTLCLRYNRTQCNNANCKFEHRCAVRLPNGQACGGQHPAHKHRFKAKAQTDSEGTASTAAS